MFAQTKDTTRDSTKTKKTKTTITTTTIITENAGTDSLGKKSTKKIQKKYIKEEVDGDLPTNKKNIIKINLTSFFISTFHLNYERVINKKVTLQLGTHYSFFDSGFSNRSINRDKGIRGFGITPEIRFYPNGAAPVGFFIALSPRFQYYTFTNETYNGLNNSQISWTGVGVGFLMGRQWLVGDKVSIDMYFGPSINYTDRTQTGSKSYSPNIVVNRVGFRCGLTLGFAL